MHTKIESRQQCPIGVMQPKYTQSMGGLQQVFHDHVQHRLMYPDSRYRIYSPIKHATAMRAIS